VRFCTVALLLPLASLAAAGCSEEQCTCPHGCADIVADRGETDAAPDADGEITGPEVPVDGLETGEGSGDDGGAARPEVRVRPASATFEVGDRWPMIAEARATPADPWLPVTDEATWASSTPAVASVGTGGELSALAVGETDVTATWRGTTSPPAHVTVVRAGGLEARGLWVTRWNYDSAEDVRGIVAAMADAGFNQIYFQVRGRADAFYRSAYEPWAAELSGTLGVDPGWDPLQTAIDAAHARGLEVHAWLNTFPCWSGYDPPPHTAPEQLYNAHPEWIVADESGTRMALNDSYVFCSPGIPEVREHVANVARDIDDKYEVDGIHMDYIRYPGPEYSHDATSEARYAEARALRPDLTYEDWQREQVTELVGLLYETLAAVGDGTVLSAAVWGIYRNTFGWSAVSQGYVEYYQDPRAWTAAGLIDAICPMIYWPLTEPPGLRTDFRTLVADHVAGNPDRFVYAGMHGDYDDFAEIAAEIAVARELGAGGTVIFAYPNVVEHDYWDDLRSGPFAEPAAPPSMPWRW
jgi:uncharacterized lipoprotein YddW (UPF0748 family)